MVITSSGIRKHNVIDKYIIFIVCDVSVGLILAKVAGAGVPALGNSPILCMSNILQTHNMT